MLVDRSRPLVKRSVKLGDGKLQAVTLERHLPLVSLSDVRKVRL